MAKGNKNYFIDLENVGNRWLDILGEVRAGDRIDIFYTSSNPVLHYPELERILSSAARFTLTSCASGNNALDFQLCTELGHRVSQNGGGAVSYIILSNDNGFDAVVSYWRERSVDIARRALPAAAPKAEKPAASAPKPDKKAKQNAKPPAEETAAPDDPALRAQYLERLSRHKSISQKDAAQIAAILTETMREPSEKRAASTYRRIVSAFGQQKGLTVYNQVKSTITDIVKNGPFPA